MLNAISLPPPPPPPQSIFMHSEGDTLSGNLLGSIFSREGDITSTQNLLISFNMQAKFQSCNNFCLPLLWGHYCMTNFYEIMSRRTVQNMPYACLKAYRLSEFNFCVYIKSCQYSMLYTNKMFRTRSQV